MTDNARALNALAAVNEKQHNYILQMQADHKKQIDQHAENEKKMLENIQRAGYDNNRAAESLNSSVSFLKGALLAVIDNRGGGRQPVFPLDSNVGQAIQGFPAIPSPFLAATSPGAQRRLSAHSAFSFPPVPGTEAQRSPESPFHPIPGSSPVAGPFTSTAAAAGESPGNQVSAESLGRFFASQNPEVLQQLWQMFTSNAKTPTSQ
jgi:hypothetical protein